MRGHTTGRKSFHHPLVGDLTLGYQSMDLSGTSGQRLVAYFAEPGSPEDDALALLDMASPVAEPARGPVRPARVMTTPGRPERAVSSG